MKALIMDGEWAPRDPASLSEESIRERIAPAREVWRNVHRTIQDVPEPRLGPFEVIVQPKVTAICGSDFLRMEEDSEGYMTHWSRCAFPIIAGHEVGGTVVEVGKNVKHLKVGDHVTTEVGNYCGSVPGLPRRHPLLLHEQSQSRLGGAGRLRRVRGAKGAQLLANRRSARRLLERRRDVRGGVDD